jgi:predicted RNA binding protein YcfA (HicA-like mRNA interferase family)
MTRRDFSGEELYKVLVNAGGFEHVRTTGDHLILRWDPPSDHDVDPRIVSVPLHDSVAVGTLRSIAEDAGANDFEAFCDWVDRNA